ncbi:MAG: hypothetical protein FDW93_03610 [Bergeyella sp.]|nr:hypothetical protein [Bergeyella sp.]
MERLVVVVIFLSFISCAKLGSPIGGAKDTIPPRLIGYNIDTSRVNVSTSARELRLYFDEYVVLKDVRKNLIISPPIEYKKIVPTQLGNKYISIQWDKPLKENTTYNFNFGNSISDLNEGNVLHYFNFAFSTGEKMDRLFLSGTVKSGYFLPEKNAAASSKKNHFLVGLYPLKGSVDYTKKPYYVTLADPDGYFELDHLAQGEYQLLAFDDTDENGIFSPGKEEVYFSSDTLYLNKKGVSGLDIKLFPSRKKLKFKESKEIQSGILFLFEGNPRKVDIVSQEESLLDYKIQHCAYSDSAYVWLGRESLEAIDKKKPMSLKFRYQADSLKGATSIFYKGKENGEIDLSNAVGTKLLPSQKMILASNYPVTKIYTDNWKLSSDSVYQSFSVNVLERDPTKIKIAVNSEFVPGRKYTLLVPEGSVFSNNKVLSKNHQFNFEIEKKEELGSLRIEFSKVPNAKFWVQLLDSKGDIKYSRYTQDKTIWFDDLRPDIYWIRILVDENENGIWEAVDFSLLKPAEPAYLYDKPIEIKPLWELVENSWNPFVSGVGSDKRTISEKVEN